MTRLVTTVAGRAVTQRLEAEKRDPRIDPPANIVVPRRRDQNRTVEMPLALLRRLLEASS